MSSILLHNAFILSILVLPLHQVFCLVDQDRDLSAFVTRPELRAPIFNVTAIKPEAVSPGYWFTAPYDDLYSSISTKKYETCQVGPQIYDSYGNLVWSGACMFSNLPSCDFRAGTRDDGSQFLSLVLAPDDKRDDDKRSVGLILDDTFEVARTIHMIDEIPRFNMHEFNIIDGGNTALVITTEFTEHNISQLSVEADVGRIANDGFMELDLSTEETKVVFEWKSGDHIPILNSRVSYPHDLGEPSTSWDFIHMNSVDKNADGDYLVSGRHTSAIYKVSGTDGHVMWQLGGKESSFKMEGFNFGYQHDARFRYEDESTSIITFLNNAADLGTAISEYSSAMMIKMDMDTMTAKPVKIWDRPDHELTRKRGNVQVLDDGNVVVGWSENSYVTEYSPDGEMVLEAQLASHRFETYRAYKFNFTGRPSEPPALKAYSYGVSPSSESTTTVYYVSWNGATEVGSWNFYGAANDTDDEEFAFIGNAIKTGFETTFIASGLQRRVYVEGVSNDGERLGRSDEVSTIVPSAWNADGAPTVDSDLQDEISRVKALAVKEMEDKLAAYMEQSAQMDAGLVGLMREMHYVVLVFLALLVLCTLAGAAALAHYATKLMPQSWRQRRSNVSAWLGRYVALRGGDGDDNVADDEEGESLPDLERNLATLDEELWSADDKQLKPFEA